MLMPYMKLNSVGELSMGAAHPGVLQYWVGGSGKHTV